MGLPRIPGLYHRYRMRELLTANRTYYVRTDGSDANTGLTNTAAGAFLTLAAAYTAIRSKLDFAGFTVTIQCGDGTYAAGLTINSAWLGGGALIIKGENTTGFVIGGTGNGIVITVPLPGNVTVQNVKFDGAAGSGKIALGVQAAAKLIIGANVIFGLYASGYHLQANAPGAYIVGSSGYTVILGAAVHMYVTGGAYIQIEGSTVTVGDAMLFAAFSWAYAVAESGKIRCTCTFTSYATGARYSVAMNGVIQTGTGSPTYFPGDAAGAAATGGQYV